MNKHLGLQLAVYSLVLAGLSSWTYTQAPELTRPTLLTGLAGAGLCLVWAVRALLGKTGKALPILTLIPVCYILLGQAIAAWSRSEPLSGIQAPMTTLLFVVSLAMLMRIVYAGVFFRDGGPRPPERPAASTKPARKPALPAVGKQT